MSRVLEAFLENQTALRRYLRRFALSAADIEDLVQETFLKAFAAEGERKILFPKAFLFRVARNLALNEKSKLSFATTEQLEDFEDQSVLIDTSHTPADEEMMVRQQVRLLAQAVASLPPQCSRVFVLRKVQGLSYKEIAGRLNISVSTVEKHVALGLVRCSEYLRQKGYEIDAKTGHMSGLANGERGATRTALAAPAKPVEVINLRGRARSTTSDE